MHYIPEVKGIEQAEDPSPGEENNLMIEGGEGLGSAVENNNVEDNQADLPPLSASIKTKPSRRIT